ncbi:phosphatase PAP2 family protein [Methanobrevibacter sp.]|uniref:phosphatase PAP2 family protein n=1 Tax=Methanobrevibacter sp. TaxID=66852 RepID=UPI00388EAE96
MFTMGFLLFLQGIRESAGGVLNSFFMSCTDFGNLPIILFLIAILYWTYDKKLGEYLLVSLSFARIANSFSKLTACVYRPWISNPNIHPYEKALEASTGYSFPSGHISSGTILFIGPILRGNITKGLKFFFVFCLVLIAFTRCYFGVHYLTDVIGAFIISLIVLFVVGKLFDKLEDNPNFDLIIVGAGILLSIILLAYATFKSYPMDYNSAGKLIVDPAKMVVDAYKDVGFTLGILISWVIERRFIKFSSDGPLERKFLRIGGAYIGYLFLMQVLYPVIKSSFDPQMANLLTFSMFPVYVILVIPAIIKFFQNRNKDIYTD